jgi:hypothetical protein
VPGRGEGNWCNTLYIADHAPVSGIKGADEFTSFSYENEETNVPYIPELTYFNNLICV